METEDILMLLAARQGRRRRLQRLILLIRARITVRSQNYLVTSSLFDPEESPWYVLYENRDVGSFTSVLSIDPGRFDYLLYLKKTTLYDPVLEKGAALLNWATKMPSYMVYFASLYCRGRAKILKNLKKRFILKKFGILLRNMHFVRPSQVCVESRNLVRHKSGLTKFVIWFVLVTQTHLMTGFVRDANFDLRHFWKSSSRLLEKYPTTEQRKCYLNSMEKESEKAKMFWSSLIVKRNSTLTLKNAHWLRCLKAHYLMPSWFVFVNDLKA